MPLEIKRIVLLKFAWQRRYLTDKMGSFLVGGGGDIRYYSFKFNRRYRVTITYINGGYTRITRYLQYYEQIVPSTTQRGVTPIGGCTRSPSKDHPKRRFNGRPKYTLNRSPDQLPQN